MPKRHASITLCQSSYSPDPPLEVEREKFSSETSAMQLNLQSPSLRITQISAEASGVIVLSDPTDCSDAGSEAKTEASA